MKTLFILLTFLLTHNVKSQEAQYMPWLRQINAHEIHQAGLSGKGVKIGIIDAGFNRADTSIYTSYLFENSQIKFVKDYVNDTCTSIFDTDTEHGFMSLAQMCGVKNNNTYYGMATNAEYYLARTEFGPKDFRDEEKNFEKAVEDLYQQGVRLINVSLSYTDNYENKEEAYSTTDINGKTTYITKVCNKWATKGVIFVVGAGNKGLSKWKILGAPADAENVITVGATGPKMGKINELNERTSYKAGFSSIGSESTKYIKPELVLYSAWGTSFTAPVITGIIACLLEYNPDLDIHSIKQILTRASNLYQAPNNYVGYGIPNCQKIIQQLRDKIVEINTVKHITAHKNIDLNVNSDDVVAFYKKDKTKVIKQKRLKPKNGKITIKNNTDCAYTTIVDGVSNVYEIEWK